MNDTASNLGLGARISMLFAVGGLLVSLVLAAATLLLTRQQLLDTREQAAAAMAISNATRLSNQLTPDSTIEDLPTIADSLTRIEGSQRIIRLGEAWLPAPELDRNDLPPSLVQLMARREAGQMLATVRDKPHLVVAIPLVAFDADYYAVLDLVEVERTLDSLQFVLLGAGATTTLSYFVYTSAFERGQMGYASAVAWTLFVMVFLLTIINWKYGSRYVNE